jgi:hypothetical protein
MSQRPLLSLAVLAIVLAACGESTPPDVGLRQAEGSVYTRQGSPPVLALGLVVADAAALMASDTVSAQDLIEIAPDRFVGPITGSTEGAVVVDLPATADLPAGAIVPLENALLNLDAFLCAPVAVPGDAMATVSVFEGASIPGMLGLTADGAFPLVATDVPVPADVAIEAFGGTFYGWLHVDRDATLATGGGCTQFDVELVLAEGWNQIAWSLEDGPSLRARVVDPTPFVAYAFTPVSVTVE